MKTQTYEYVLQRACELTGRVFPPTNEEAVMFRGYIAASLRLMWEAVPWPDTIEYSKEYFAKFYDSTVSDAAGTFVWFGNTQKYYQALTTSVIYDPADSDGAVNSAEWIEVNSSNYSAEVWDASTTYSVGDVVTSTTNGYTYALFSNAPSGTPTSDSDYWGRIYEFVRTVDRVENKDETERETELGEIFGVWNCDPRITNFLKKITFSAEGTAIRIDGEYDYVWVKYRTTPPSLSSDPSTIPYRFSEYVASRAAAMMMAVDGKVDAAKMLIDLAEDCLNAEADKFYSQESQSYPVTVLTR